MKEGLENIVLVAQIAGRNIRFTYKTSIGESASSFLRHPDFFLIIFIDPLAFVSDLCYNTGIFSREKRDNKDHKQKETKKWTTS